MEVLKTFLRVSFGTLGIGLVTFGFLRGVQGDATKFRFIPIGIALVVLVWYIATRRK
jgi:hypothetical protein